MSITTILIAALVIAAIVAIAAEAVPLSARHRSLLRGVVVAIGLIGIAQILRIVLALSAAM